MRLPRGDIVPDYDADGRKVWTCSDCGQRGYWADGWMWFGAIDDVERVMCPKCAPIGVELIDAPKPRRNRADVMGVE